MLFMSGTTDSFYFAKLPIIIEEQFPPLFSNIFIMPFLHFQWELCNSVYRQCLTVVTLMYQPAHLTVIIFMYQPAHLTVIIFMYQQAHLTVMIFMYQPAHLTVMIFMYQPAHLTVIIFMYQPAHICQAFNATVVVLTFNEVKHSAPATITSCYFSTTAMSSC